MTTIGLVSAGLLTFPQGLGLGLRRKRRHPGTGWLVALVGVRVSLSSCALPTIFAGVGQTARRRTHSGPRGPRSRLCACALRSDDAPTGHGRARRELASVGPTGRTCCARSRLGIRRVRPQDAGCGWARDDRSDAVVDGSHRCHPFGLLRRRDRSGPGLRPDHRAEHLNGDQFRNGGDRREYHSQDTGGRLHPVQSDRRPDRAGVIPCHHSSARPRRERHRWRDAAGCFPHGVQRRRRLRPRAGDRLVYAIPRNRAGDAAARPSQRDAGHGRDRRADRGRRHCARRRSHPP